VAELLAFVGRHGYLVLFLFVFAEQVGLPLPALPILLAGGALARTGELHPAAVVAVCVAASLLSDVLWYEVGRRRGGRVMGWLCRISLEPDSCVRNTEAFFARHGARSLLVAKFVPGLNTAAPPMAGIFGMRFARFLLYDALGALVWVLALAGLGYVFGHELEELLGRVEATGTGLALLALAVVVLWIAYKFVQRRRFLRELRIARITPEELARRLAAGEDLVVVDLRHRADFALDPHTVPGALHLPVEELAARRGEIPGDGELVLLCT
jgi:membrane protein DedA with SNARE-associated domain